MYPRLLIDTKKAMQNAASLRRICLSSGVEPVAVVKGFNGLWPLTAAMLAVGYKRIGSSRIPHLRVVKERGAQAETMLLRIPMLSELKELIHWCDISLVSEPEVLRALDSEAASQGKFHKVILMRDVGDLREGILPREQFYSTAEMIEQTLPHLHLEGIGANMTCYGSILPTTDNVGELVEDAHEIEQRIGRRLNTVSGGASSALPLVLNGKLPDGVTELRIGNAIMLPQDLSPYDCTIPPELSNQIFTLQAEIVELGEKPTMPIGVIGVDGFGSRRHYEDRGIRRRALLALGALDVGSCEKLTPLDPGITILGASSDHLIIDIQDSDQHYSLGGIAEFTLSYQSMMHATLSPFIEKVVI